MEVKISFQPHEAVQYCEKIEFEVNEFIASWSLSEEKEQ